MKHTQSGVLILDYELMDGIISILSLRQEGYLEQAEPLMEKPFGILSEDILLLTKIS